MTCQERPKDKIFHLCSVFSWALQPLTSESFWNCALPESQSALEFKITQKKNGRGQAVHWYLFVPQIYPFSAVFSSRNCFCSRRGKLQQFFCLIFKSNEQSQPWDLLSISENLHTLCYILCNIKTHHGKKLSWPGCWSLTTGTDCSGRLCGVSVLEDIQKPWSQIKGHGPELPASDDPARADEWTRIYTFRKIMSYSHIVWAEVC